MDGASDQPERGWGPFERPLFEDPSSRALARVGVIDVGSNSVRMVVFDGAARSPAYFFNEKLMCGLGRGLGETGRLNPEGRIKALGALKRFMALAKGMGIAPPIAVATAAVREAEDGPAFREEIERETGLRLFVIDGQEEARLSAQGVLLGWPDAKGLVCDIGGSSMELAEIEGGTVKRRLTSPLGPFKLQSLGGRQERKKFLNATMKRLLKEIPLDEQLLYLVGGSWRAIARVDMLRRNYPLSVLHEYRMTQDSVLATTRYIEERGIQEIRADTGLSAERAAVVPIACEVLRSLVTTFRPTEIAISSYGIREGLLYEQMPDQLRKRDPLIEACHFAEKKDARLPGFGRSLYRFLQPLYAASPPARQRIVKAACLLHDVTWRAHPDYRAEICFDNATRANLGGLTHLERVFLGLALLHRYKNSRSDRFDDLVKLLPERQARDAEILGKAMRFGAMFAMQDPDPFATLTWLADENVLRIEVDPEHRDMFGDVARARFRSLANALEATADYSSISS